MSQELEIDETSSDTEVVAAPRKMGRRAALLAAGVSLVAVACDDSENDDFGPLVGGAENGEDSDSPAVLGFIDGEEVAPGDEVAAPAPVVVGAAVVVGDAVVVGAVGVVGVGVVGVVGVG